MAGWRAAASPTDTKKQRKTKDKADELGVFLIGKRGRSKVEPVCSGCLLRGLFPRCEEKLYIITSGDIDRSEWKNCILYCQRWDTDKPYDDKLKEYALADIWKSEKDIEFIQGLSIIPIDAKKLGKGSLGGYLRRCGRSGMLTYRPYQVKSEEYTPGSLADSFCQIVKGDTSGFAVKSFDLDYMSGKYVLKLPENGHVFKTWTEVTGGGSNSLHPHGAVILRQDQEDQRSLAVAVLKFVDDEISPVLLSQISDKTNNQKEKESEKSAVETEYEEEEDEGLTDHKALSGNGERKSSKGAVAVQNPAHDASAVHGKATQIVTGRMKYAPKPNNAATNVDGMTSNEASGHKSSGDRSLDEVAIEPESNNKTLVSASAGHSDDKVLLSNRNGSLDQASQHQAAVPEAVETAAIAEHAGSSGKTNNQKKAEKSAVETEHKEEEDKPPTENKALSGNGERRSSKDAVAVQTPAHDEASAVQGKASPFVTHRENFAPKPNNAAKNLDGVTSNEASRHKPSGDRSLGEGVIEPESNSETSVSASAGHSDGKVLLSNRNRSLDQASQHQAAVPEAVETAAIAEHADPEQPGGVTSRGRPVKEEMTVKGGKEGRPPIQESRSAACRRLSDLPRPIPNFVNRMEKLIDIKKFLSHYPGNVCECVLIHGATGMGKTATAIKAANEIRDNTDDTAIIYVNCKYVSSLDDLAGKISKQLNHFPLNEPVSQGKRRLIKEEDLYTVVLLDNWEFLESGKDNTKSEGRIGSMESQKIKNFILEIVRGTAKVKLLVTSSQLVTFQDTGQQYVTLSPFNDEDSFQLLKNVYGDQYQLEKETATKIAQFCGGIPHALNILASQMDFPLDLVKIMTNANPTKKFEIFTRIPHAEEDKKLDVCLDACFERLDPHLQATLVSLTLLRGRFTISTAEEVFKAEKVSHQILELRKRSFLEQNTFNPTGPCWYSFLTVQKFYCLSKAQEAPFREVFGGARNMFIEYFLAFLEDNFKKFLSKGVLEAITAFRQEEENIMQLTDWVGNGEMEDDQKGKCIDVFNNVAELFAKMMGKKRFEALFTKLKQKSEEMKDQKRLSECLTSLGIREVFNLFFSTGLQHEETAEKAKRYLEHSRGIQTALQINTGNSRAQCLAKLGRILAKENNFRKARDMIRQAIEIRIQHGEQDRVMLGATHNDMAVAISLQAKQQQQGAHELLKEAIDIREKQTLPIYRRELGGHHPFTATILDSVSVNYHDLGDLVSAKRYAEEALRIRQEVLQDHTDTAKSLFDLAMVYKSMKEFTEAKKYLEKCETMQEKLLENDNSDLERTRRELKDVNKQLRSLQPD